MLHWDDSKDALGMLVIAPMLEGLSLRASGGVQNQFAMQDHNVRPSDPSIIPRIGKDFFRIFRYEIT
jgi:hypothetical protein